MRASGNGNPETCAYNILRTVRGEVAYERTKGVDGALIDAPAIMAAGAAEADALRQIEIFEPRMEVDDIAITGQKAGDLNYDITMHRKEGTTWAT